MVEHYSVPLFLGKKHLSYKMEELRKAGLEIIDVRCGEVPQPGSLSSPFAANYGRVESGWIIDVENGVKPYRSIITGEMVTEM